MDFSFSSDQQLLKNSARAFLDEHCKPAAVRLLGDDPRGESEAMWKEMAQLGWLGLSLPEVYGGSGLGMVETSILLEELGRAAYPGPYWPTILSAAAVEAAGTDTQKKRWLSAIATGDARGEVVEGLDLVRHEALRPVGPRGQRAADPGACARRPVPVPRRPLGGG